MKAARTAPRNLLSPRTTTQVATWNVRTMYETGKTAQIAAEMSRYKLAIPSPCETRWTRSEHIRLATGETLIYSGHEEEDTSHTEGVGLMLCKGAAGALLHWKVFSSRIISARFHTRIRKVLIVQFYAPTNDSVAEKKSEFYERLQAVVDQNTNEDLLIMIGDFNAKIGNDNIGKELGMGKEGLGEINKNGELPGYLPTFVTSTAWLSGEVYSYTRGFTTPHGFNQTIRQRTRLITVLLEDPCKTSDPRGELM